MSADEEENARMVALSEALAESRALIEELTRVGEELRVRQDHLGELLAPSEQALKARTEYLDRVMREQLGQAEQQLTRLSNDVQAIARNLSDHVREMPALMVEVDRQRAEMAARREWWKTGLSLLVMLLGGFLAGQAATCRTNPGPVVTPASEASAAPVKSPLSPHAGRPHVPSAR